jgi:hypothetical protein
VCPQIGPYSPSIGETVPYLAPVRAGPLPELGAIAAVEVHAVGTKPPALTRGEERSSPRCRAVKPRRWRAENE